MRTILSFLNYRCWLASAVMALGLFACGNDDDDVNPEAPTARIETAAPAVGLGSIVTLDGSSSTDPQGGTLTYEWELVSTPAGSNATLSSTSAAAVTFRADEAGDYRARLTVRNAVASDQAEITVRADPGQVTFPVEVGSNITQATTWRKLAPAGQVDYILTNGITVSAALTIEPGVIVACQEGTAINVAGSGASLKAEGTAQQRIVFRGTNSVRGFWGYLHFESNSINNVLSFVSVSDAGSAARYSSIPVSSVSFYSGQLRVRNTEISNGAGHGLFVRNDANLAAFSNNTIRTHSEHPIRVSSQRAGRFDRNSTFENNTNNTISVYSSGGFGSDTLANVGIPYQLAGEFINVTGGLVIEPGAVLEFDENGGLSVTGAQAFLKAVGTSSQKITFRGTNNVRGYWNGLHFESNSLNNQLIHTVIQHTGKNSRYPNTISPASVYLYTGRCEIRNSEISEGEGFGVVTRNASNGGTLSGYANNVISNHKEFPLYLTPNQLNAIDNASTYTNNDQNFIAVFSSTLNQNVTWKKATVPYMVQTGWLEVRANVTVEPGTEIRFEENAGIEIESGFFNATGTAGDRIVFRGRETTPGYWAALHFEANSMNNRLVQCEIRHGGSLARYSGALANVYLYSGQVTVNNSTVANSAGWGIVRRQGTLNQTGNQFNGNALGNVGP